MTIEKDPEIVSHVLSIVDGLEQHIHELNKLVLEVNPKCGHITETLMPKILSSEEDLQSSAKECCLRAADFAEKGMELGYLFASRGMELGYQFASKGEEVGPMANRILFMATQIGVMADRIGEMADRILFMGDRVVAFGNRITYVSQLIIYTEQLIVNVGVLITETTRIASDLMLTLVALVMNNETFLQNRCECLKNTWPLPLIYENMNIMLHNMHEFSLKQLESETRDKENELKVRELQIKLREETLRANECFCPCFCVQPDNVSDDTPK